MVMHAIASCLTWFIVNCKFPVTAQSRASSDHFSTTKQSFSCSILLLTRFFFFFQRVMIWFALCTQLIGPREIPLLCLSLSYPLFESLILDNRYCACDWSTETTVSRSNCCAFLIEQENEQRISWNTLVL